MSKKVGIQVGANRDAILAARDAIGSILRADHDEKTIRTALRSFTTVCQVSHVAITNNLIRLDDTVEGIAVEPQA